MSIRTFLTTVMFAFPAIGITAAEPEEPRCIVDSIETRSNGNISIDANYAIIDIARQDTVADDRSSLNPYDNEQAREKRLVHRAGYRIQAYTDSNQRTAKARAQSIANNISDTFPEYKQYLAYNAPYWRLRIGDFLTQEEAMEALTQLKKAFPSLANEMRIVRDRINHLE